MDDASTGIPCNGPAPPQTFHYGPHPDCPECGPDYEPTDLEHHAPSRPDTDAIRDGLEKDRMAAVIPPRPKDVRIIADLLAEVERLRANLAERTDGAT